MTDGERIAVLEANYQHTIKTMDTMAEQLQEVHDLLLKAKGMKWLILTMVVVTGTVSTVIVWFASFFGVKMP